MKKISMIKRRWNREEDELLQKLVEEHGVKNWSLIGQWIQGWSEKSCRFLWYNHLNPQLNHWTLTLDEDDTIIKAHAKFGNELSMIACLLSGRTDKAIKNHWNSFLTWKRPLMLEDSTSQNPHHHWWNCLVILRV